MIEREKKKTGKDRQIEQYGDMEETQLRQTNGTND